MSKMTVGFIVALFCSALIAGGCAKKELVKGEADVPAASVTQPAEVPVPAKPPIRALARASERIRGSFAGRRHSFTRDRLEERSNEDLEV